MEEEGKMVAVDDDGDDDDDDDSKNDDDDDDDDKKHLHVGCVRVCVGTENVRVLPSNLNGLLDLLLA